MSQETGAVIVTHANADMAVACVRSLRDTVEQRHLVVVVNLPDRADQGALRELRELATVISPPNPLGYGANANLGVAALPGDAAHVLISNDDVEFTRGALPVLSAVLSQHADVAVVGPLLTDSSGQLSPTCHAFPSLLSEVRDHVLLPRRVAGLIRSDAVPASAGIRRVDWVLGAVLMIRRAPFEAIGGFDPAFVLYSEEIDLCHRLLDRGWQTVACGEASAVHVGGASTGGGGLWEIGAASRGIYIRRHWPRRRRLTLATLRAPVDVWNMAYALWSHLPSSVNPPVRLGSVALRHRYMRAAWRMSPGDQSRTTPTG